MNDEHATAMLSAMMDEALNEEEMTALLVELQNKPELVQTWRRYHVLQALLQENILFDEDIQKELKTMQNSATEVEPTT